jgi:hypothetical protein
MWKCFSKSAKKLLDLAPEYKYRIVERAGKFYAQENGNPKYPSLDKGWCTIDLKSYDKEWYHWSDDHVWKFGGHKTKEEAFECLAGYLFVETIRIVAQWEEAPIIVRLDGKMAIVPKEVSSGTIHPGPS